MPTTYSYACVSSRDQNLDRQMDALAAFGVPAANVFSDKASGKDFDCPAYRRLVSAMCPRDVLVVKSIDRLGRNYNEIVEEWRRLTKTMGCAVAVIDMPLLDTRSSRSDVTGTFISDLVLQLLSYVAQVERDGLRQRQAEGIAAGRVRGARFGRPPKKRPKCYEETSTRGARQALGCGSAACERQHAREVAEGGRGEGRRLDRRPPFRLGLPSYKSRRFWTTGNLGGKPCLPTRKRT